MVFGFGYLDLCFEPVVAGLLMVEGRRQTAFTLCRLPFTFNFGAPALQLTPEEILCNKLYNPPRRILPRVCQGVYREKRRRVV